MKRIALILILICSISSVVAQKGKVAVALNLVETGNLAKAMEAVNKATEHEKSKDWAKTYYAKGKVLQAIHDANNPEFNKFSENPLIEAFDNYKKAMKMDEEKGRLQSQIDLNLIFMVNQFVNKGIEEFNGDDFAKSLEYFEYAMEIGNMPVFEGSVDTAIIYNAALAANNANNYDKAIKYFTRAKDMNYGEANIYLLLRNAYLAKQDSLNAINTLKEGLEVYPDNADLLIQIINYYLVAGDNQVTLDYLNRAKESDQENPIFYFVEGTVYENIKQPEKATDSYKTSIELDPEYFDPHFNLGVYHFNNAKDIYDYANTLKDFDEYEKEKTRGDEELRKTLPYMEQAHKIKPEDILTLDTLKTVYYRLQMIDKHDETLKKIEELKNK